MVTATVETAPQAVKPATPADFTSTIPWQDAKADCIVFCCSDQRFEEQTDEFLASLGFKHPHKIQFPSGPALLHPLVAGMGFLSKAADSLMEKAVEVTKAGEMVIIGHQQCGAYKASQHPLVNTVFKAATGTTIEDVQMEHLRSAGRRVQQTVRGIKVSAYFARIVNTGEGDRVQFKPVPLKG